MLIRQSADFAMNTGGRLAGVTPPAMPTVDDTSFAAAKSRVETALGFVKSLTLRTGRRRGGQGYRLDWRRQLLGNEGQGLSATVRELNFFFFVTTAYNILRHRGVPLKSGISSARSTGYRAPQKLRQKA